LIPSIFLFTVSSIICAVANNFTVLLVGRVIQGIGGGGIVTLAQIIFGDIVPLRQRPKYFSLVLGAWAIGSVAGPIIGAAFVQEVTWRWCFWINLPICGIALPLSFFCVKLHTERKSLLEKVKLVDWAGGFVFIGSLTSALVAISSGGIEHAWDSWRTLVPLIIGVTGVVLSLLWERYGAKNPFLYRSLFPNLSAIVTYLNALAQGLVLFCGLYYVVFYFSAARLRRPINASVGLLPAVVFVLPGSVVVSSLITRFGRYRWAIWVGWVFTTIGCGLLILLDENTVTAVHATALSVLGLGLGMVLSALNFASQASVTDTKDSGRAAAMYAFMRTMGFTIGVAFGGTIFQNLLKQRLRELGVAQADNIATHAEGFVEEILRQLPLSEPLRAPALEAYAYGFQGVFIAMTAVSGVALVGSAFVKHFELDKTLESRYSLSVEKRQSGRTLV
jgi:MFS family permease